ncbi:protease modulator HflK [Calycomorphotria hydatis]|uniref:Modulator of FtsH protease HflK n=1 Tax=Calycomorphotria hydatis TaxID=2528027 RepID=A0A517TA10_9PLAN|nr:protease modulator HflK [Calycomorphotria hydatis]QDT65210.1 Modulator of FtsH protease HflK [Calycomorphotria hydatis]
MNSSSENEERLSPEHEDTFVPPHVPPKEKSADRYSIVEGAAAGLRMVMGLAVLLFVLFWCSGITTIQPGEVGLVLRCGRLVGNFPDEQIHEPGLLFALPYPIDKVIKVPVKQEREITIAALRPKREADREYQREEVISGYALSGDHNILRADLVLKYRIQNPIAYQLRFSEPERILRDVVTSATVEVIAGWKVEDALRLQVNQGEESLKLPVVIRRTAQELCDELNLGVELSSIEVREIQPPEQVAAAFQSVQSERIAIETKKREAEGYAARTIPAAEAARNTLVQDANRFATDLETRADEEVSIFDKLYAEYLRNPELVWNRLHLETVEGLMRDGGQFRFVDPGTRLILTPRESQRTPSASKTEIN